MPLITQTAFEPRLTQRLADHAVGRGARLTQVQIERGGFWVLAQTQLGDRTTERRLQQHGATRRCEVCKAVDSYRSGELTAEEALARAGWDRSNEVQRSLLLEIFALPEPPGAAPAPAPAASPPNVPAPRPEPPSEPEPTPTPDAEMDAVVDALIQGWSTPEADAHSEPEPDLELEAAQ